MKVCTTCGRQWDTIGGTCPDDGGPLAVVVGSSGTVTAQPGAPRVDAVSDSSGARAALLRAPDPEPEADATVVDHEYLPEGMQVGEYQIERQIGVGGMGVVYGARHPVIGKRAAIKVLNARLSRDREAVQRFVLEAQAVNQIGHANIVDIFSFGTLDDGRSYFVMEWLVGETLGERLERGRLTVRETTTILTALCRALEAAHAAGVVHRDLKPDNVFLVTDDDGVRVKLLDFGIAKLSTAAPGISKTATGMVVGTPLFMAPEQARGEAIDGRTDVYALGLLAYAMVTGGALFESETSAIEVLAAHISRPPPPPRSIVADLPPALDALILEMVDKRPAFRPSLVDVRQQLAAIAGGLGPATSPAVQVPRLTVRAGSDVAQAAVITSAPTALVAATGAGPAVDDAELDAPARARRWPLALAGLVAIGAVAAIVILQGSGGTGAKAPPAPVAATPAAPVAPAPVAPVVTPPPHTGSADVVAAAPPPTELKVTPADAQLVVDGAAVALTGGHASMPLPVGEHTAVATAGGRSARRTFTVTAEHPATIALAVPAASAPAGGAKVTARPTGSPPPAGSGAGAVDVDGVQDPFKK